MFDKIQTRYLMYQIHSKEKKSTARCVKKKKKKMLEILKNLKENTLISIE